LSLIANEDEHDELEHDDDEEEDDDEDEDFSHSSECITGLNADAVVVSDCKGIFNLLSICCI